MNYISYVRCFITSIILLFFMTSCSETYYDFMEKFGFHKRDILIDRVEDTQDAQEDAQKEFESALEQFISVIQIENSNLKKTYDNLNNEYQNCLLSAEKVYDRIEQVESVSEALFKEWEVELNSYQNLDLQQHSSKRLSIAWGKYNEMLAVMYESLDSMSGVLYILRDNVMFLKHNLNAQAIGALSDEFSNLQIEVNELIMKMQLSIETSNEFISEITINDKT